MRMKSAYHYALGVVAAVVLAAGMVIGTAGVVLAENNEGAGYGTMEPSFSSESGMDQEQSYSGEIREPVETGAIPDQSLSSADLHSESTDELPAVGVWGREYRPGVDGE